MTTDYHGWVRNVGACLQAMVNYEVRSNPESLASKPPYRKETTLWFSIRDPSVVKTSPGLVRNHHLILQKDAEVAEEITGQVGFSVYASAFSATSCENLGYSFPAFDLFRGQNLHSFDSE
ncbi:MAG TPA: hypothetical protein VK641_04070 [Terriglobales bacterium]|nr:hypothetical protein [Terriglobales bacterium]